MRMLIYVVHLMKKKIKSTLLHPGDRGWSAFSLLKKLTPPLLSPLAAQMHLGPHRICTMNRGRERGSFSPDPEFCAKHDSPIPPSRRVWRSHVPRVLSKKHVNLAGIRWDLDHKWEQCHLRGFAYILPHT